MRKMIFATLLLSTMGYASDPQENNNEPHPSVGTLMASTRKPSSAVVFRNSAHSSSDSSSSSSSDSEDEASQLSTHPGLNWLKQETAHLETKNRILDDVLKFQNARVALLTQVTQDKLETAIAGTTDPEKLKKLNAIKSLIEERKKISNS